MFDTLLLTTATKLEAEPFRTNLRGLEQLTFPLGELWKGILPASQQHIYLAHLGLGKVNTAAGLALAIEKIKPSAILQFGIGGA
ncbi:MAG: hypothetical protein ACRCYY_14535, partial [Trueperaceae bacterium]